MASLPVGDHVLTPQPDPRRWRALALVCVAFFHDDPRRLDRERRAAVDQELVPGVLSADVFTESTTFQVMHVIPSATICARRRTRRW
jgi:hypothetical protein